VRSQVELVLAELSAIFRPRWQRRAKNFTFRWRLAQPGNQTFVEGHMARITNEQQVSVEVRPLTQAGRPARIDGSVEWASSDTSVATVTSTGPLSALVVSVGPGVTQISAVFDADLGEGVRPVEMTGALEVVEAEAVTAEIVFGTPQLKP
jgi:hypothetical protein